jgi:hypothetical protein
VRGRERRGEEENKIKKKSLILFSLIGSFPFFFLNQDKREGAILVLLGSFEDVHCTCYVCFINCALELRQPEKKH